jgi:hypothetical protein
MQVPRNTPGTGNEHEGCHRSGAVAEPAVSRWYVSSKSSSPLAAGYHGANVDTELAKEITSAACDSDGATAFVSPDRAELEQPRR